MRAGSYLQRPYLLVWALMFLALPTAAQLTSPYEAAVERTVLSLSFKEAEQYALQISGPRRLFYLHHLAFVRALTHPSPNSWRAFEAYSGKVEDDYEAYPQTATSAARANLYFERGVLKFLHQKQFAALLDLRRSYNLANEASNADAATEEGQRLRMEAARLKGLYEVAVASIPESYRWAAKLFGFRGDLQKGIKLLESAAGHGHFLRTEAYLLRFLVAKHILADPLDAATRIDALYQTDSLSPVITYLRVNSLVERKQNTQALTVLESAQRRFQPRQLEYIPFLRYALGRSYLLAGQYRPALAHFQQYLRQMKGSLLVRDALYRSAVCFALEQKADSARQFMKQVEAAPASGFDDDNYAARQARQYLAAPFQGNDLLLLQARWAFDGGQPERVYRLLGTPSLKNLTTDQQVELHYRLGRTAHEYGPLPDAAGHYEKCVALSPGKALWMKVYALYYLGTLAEQKGDLKTAQRWYQMAASYRDYDYRLGLEQRLKAAKNRVGML